MKAQDIADRLTVAFDTETGIPMSQVNLQKYDEAATDAIYVVTVLIPS